MGDGMKCPQCGEDTVGISPRTHRHVCFNADCNWDEQAESVTIEDSATETIIRGVGPESMERTLGGMLRSHMHALREEAQLHHESTATSFIHFIDGLDHDQLDTFTSILNYIKGDEAAVGFVHGLAVMRHHRDFNEFDHLLVQTETETDNNDD